MNLFSIKLLFYKLLLCYFSLIMDVCGLDYYLYHIFIKIYIYKNILVKINLNINNVYLQFYVPVILPEKIYFVSIFYIEKNICCKKYVVKVKILFQAYRILLLK